MSMHQCFCCFCFFLKLVRIDIKQMQYFNGCLFGSKTHMLAEVDLCEASFSQKFHKTIVSELLTEAITHRPLPSWGYSALTGYPLEGIRSQIVVSKVNSYHSITTIHG